MSSKNGQFYEFGDFRLDSEPPGLWLDGRLVPLSPKALEMLVLLVRRRDTIVSREELLETVWRDTFVEEGNINYTVSLLRKTLDKEDKGRFIQTVPKRGYRFVADVCEVARAASEANSLPPPAANESHTAVSAPVAPPKSQIRWHFLGIVLLGVFFLTSFSFWWNTNDRRGLSGTPAADRGGDAPLTDARAATSGNIRTVAVLPLESLTEGEQSRILSLGLTDALISRLGSLNYFAVRPLNSVSGYVEADLNPLEFGKRVKADAVLEGTLQASDGRLRVNARLWDVRNGAQLWQDSFDETEADIFKLQDAISTKVTQSLVSELLEKDRALLTKRHTDNPEAYRAYIRGRAIFDSKNPDNFERAIDEFSKAAALDPTFALAYVGFADAYTRLGFTTSDEQSAAFMAKAKAAANKALSLDPELAEGYAARGTVRRIYEWDWAGAESDFKRAIELNPNYARAHLGYALLLSALGRHDEALTEIKRALELDPLSQDVRSGYLPVLEGRREYAEALTLAQENVKFNKEYRRANRGVATFLFHLGEDAQVIEMAERELPVKNSQQFAWLSLLATSCHRIGQADKRDETLRQLKELAKSDSKALYSLAENYAELGRFDEALAALERCFEVREERMIWVKVEPRFANLKDDPRFQEILRKMNLAE